MKKNSSSFNTFSFQIIFNFINYAGAWIYGLAFFSWTIFCVTINYIYYPSILICLLQFFVWIIIDLLIEFWLPSSSNSIARIIFTIIRLLFCFIIFYFWAVYFMNPIADFMWLQPQVTHIIRGALLFPKTRPQLAIVQIPFFFILYHIIWHKKNRHRLFLGIICPLLFLFNNYFLFYCLNFGGVSLKDFKNSPSVELVSAMPQRNTTNFYTYLMDPHNYPRCLYLDNQRQKLYLSLGSIWPDLSNIPNFMSLSLENYQFNEVIIQDNFQLHKIIREFQPSPDSKYIYVCPWGSNSIFEIDKDSTKISASMPLYRGDKLNTYDILHESIHNRLYLSITSPPKLIRYDFSSHLFYDIDLSKNNLTTKGTILHIIRYDYQRNKIYLIAIDGKWFGALYEIDPEKMELTRMLSFNDILVSLEIDYYNNEILIGSGLSSYILVLNRDTFQIKRKISTPSPAIRKFIVCNDRNSILVVDHLKGKVDEIKRTDGTILKTYVVGNKPIGMVRDNNSVYVASTLGIVRIKLDPFVFESISK